MKTTLKLGLFLLFWSFGHTVLAQGWLGKDLSNISAKELTNSQKEELLRLAKRQGYNESDVEALARARGIELPSAAPVAASAEGRLDTTSIGKDNTQNENILQSQVAIFGQDLFSNGSVGFAPSHNLAPTPQYVLGPGDRITVRVFGLQELSVEAKVQSNGNMTIPYAGEVPLAGLALSDAESVIKQRLKKAGFASLGSGQSQMRLNISEMRSIQVLIWGAQKPGSYTLPSLATAFQALYVAGGPGTNRSYRNVRIMRNGKLLRIVDLYEYLAHGDRSSDINLQDNDIIFIPYYEQRVRLRGEVKTPAIYELLPNENLLNALNYAGGFTEIAYKETIEIMRYGNQGKEIYSVDIAALDTFSIIGAEVLTVASILDQFKGRIRVEGAVQRPGYYGTTLGMSLTAAIENAGGLSPTALKQVVLVYSNPKNGARAYKSYDLQAILSGELVVAVQENDEIFIADSQRLFIKEPVSIFGDVIHSGTYDYGDGMSVADLLLRAGGFERSAITSRVLVSRKIKDDDLLATVQTLEASREFWTDPILKGFELQPGDVVAVYHDPHFRNQVYVSCEGEFKIPGVYPVTARNQSLMDIYNQAGGVNHYGNTKNMYIVRTKRASIADVESKAVTNILLNEVYKNDSVKQFGLVQTNQTTIVDTISLFSNHSNFMSIAEQFRLMPGDRIIIPETESTVRISGAVYNPNLIVYNPKLSIREYISLSGGYVELAEKKKVYIVYPNGRSAHYKHRRFLSRSPKIEEGCNIIVPLQEGWDDEDIQLSKQERIAIYSVLSTSLSSLVFLIVQLTK